MDFPILSVIVLLPAVSGLLMMLLPGDKKETIYKVALGVAALTFLLTIVVFVSFDVDGSRYQFEEQYDWLPALGISYVLKVIPNNWIASSKPNEPPMVMIKNLNEA